MRGRGRVHHFAPPPRLYHEMTGETYSSTHSHYSERSDSNINQSRGPLPPPTHGMSSASSADSMVTADSATVFGDSNDPRVPSSLSTDSFRGPGQVDIQRSQSTGTHPSASTTPSSMGYPAPPGSMPQYPMHPQGYFPPQWMHPYTSSYPYAVPFMPGYMGFPPPVPQSQPAGEGSATIHPGSTSITNGYKVSITSSNTIDNMTANRFTAGTSIPSVNRRADPPSRVSSNGSPCWYPTTPSSNGVYSRRERYANTYLSAGSTHPVYVWNASGCPYSQST